MSSTNKNKVFNINLFHLLSLFPLVLFSYYKNGYMVYKNQYLSFFSSLEYFVIPILIVIISYLIEIYYYIGIKKNRDYSNVVNSFCPYANLLCYLLCGPNDALYITIPLIFITDILMKILDKKITINRVALFKCILFILLVILGIYNNANIYESIMNIEIISTWEAFIGLTIGEMGVVSNLLILLCFIVLLFNKYYKKDIAIISILTYIIFGLFLVLVGNLNIIEFINNTFTSGIIFSIVYVLTLSEASPLLKSGRTIYAILTGILLTIFVNIFKINIGIYFIILIMSIISPLINKLKISISK